MSYFNLSDSANKRLLIVDGTNTFIRAMSVVDTVNEHGLPIGGFSGFLMSIGAAIKMIKATDVVIAFDYSTSTTQRKKIYPEYKGNRTKNIHNPRVFKTIEDEEVSMKWQSGRLTKYLETMPIHLINNLYEFEADDTISYVALHDKYKNHDKYIMSMDKDFFQLINKNLSVYNPTSKQIIDEKVMLSRFKILPENYIYVKSIEGDTSDNIPGVVGVKEKTMQKILPFLYENTKTINILEFEEYVKTLPDKYKTTKSLKENIERVKFNYKLMDLFNTFLTDEAKQKIDEKLNEKLESNPLQLNRLTNEDGMTMKYPMKWFNEVFLTVKR